VRYIYVHELMPADIAELHRHANAFDDDACKLLCNECPLAIIRTHPYGAHNRCIPCSKTFRVVQANYLLELYYAIEYDIECTLLGDRNDT